ncbi:MAG: SprT family zinc-dependent metalloprotease [Pseudomonadota bacterium]
MTEKVNKALKVYPFSDISPALTLKINPRAKRMALRVDAHKRVVNLVIPKRASLRSAYMFALEHKYWIRQKIDEMPEVIDYVDGARIKILGQRYKISIRYDHSLKKTAISLKDNELLVLTNKRDPSSRIRRFIINMAKERLTTLANEKAASIDKKIHSVTVRDTVSRWGSCSSDGKLSFSWRLIFAPEHAFDYVVAHEVAHLAHLDHSPAFWHQCEDISSDYSRGKTWMKRHAQELIKYA